MHLELLTTSRINLEKIGRKISPSVGNTAPTHTDAALWHGIPTPGTHIHTPYWMVFLEGWGSSPYRQLIL